MARRQLITLDLSAIGRGSAMRGVPSTAPASAFGVAYYSGAGLAQTYTRRDGGLEQVVTLKQRPLGGGALRLVVGRLAPGVHGTLHAGKVTLLSRSGLVLGSYGELHVTDAIGGVVPARIQVDGRQLVLVVDDNGADYPLRVDPYLQIAELAPTSADSALGNAERNQGGSVDQTTDTFGTSVAESANGDVLVVGAPADASAFVFVKPAHGGWQNAHPTARLKVDPAGQFTELGESVAVSGDGRTIVVGEPEATLGAGASGAALVYTEPSNGWSHSNGVAKAMLTPTEPQQYGLFGGGVAMDSAGDTIVVSASGWNSDEGALYLFKRASHGWASTSAGVTANVGEPAANSDYGGEFGASLAMSASGDVIAVGAPATSGYKGAVYVFGRDLDGYRELADTASGTSDSYFDCSGGDGYGVFNPVLGDAVAVSSDGKTIVAGEPCAGTGGQAVIYDEPSHGWDTASGNISGGLTPLRPDVLKILQLGTNVAISGDASTIVADDPLYGSTGGYVATFRRPAKGWSHVNPPVADNFGSVRTPASLASGDSTMAQGAPLAVSGGGGELFVGDDGTNGDGAVYVYELASDIASATTVSCSPSSVDTGKTTTCKATVKTKSPTATGTVTFSSTGGSAMSFDHKHCTLGRVKTGTATCSVKLTPHKRLAYVITARYGGDNNHGSGTASTNVDTPRDGTATTVSCDPSLVYVASISVCTAQVTGVGANAPALSFKVSPLVLALIGQVSCNQTGSTESCNSAIQVYGNGNYTVTAAYPGDTLDGSSDGSTPLSVDQAPTTMSGPTCSPSTIYTDTTTTCTATVSGLVGLTIPTEISFTSNGTGWTFTGETCSTATAGKETCSATYTPGNYGSPQISANYASNVANLGAAGKTSLTVDNAVALSCTGTDQWDCVATVQDDTGTPSNPSGTATLTYGVTGSSSTSQTSCTLGPSQNSNSKSFCDFPGINPHSTQQFTLVASYAGDGTHKAGSATITYQEP